MTVISLPSHHTRVWSLLITFIPATELIAVIGRVTAAITASRSAAIVIFVSVRARWYSVTPARKAT